MPLRAEPARVWLERGARLAAVALLAWSLWLATRPASDASERVQVRSAEADESLPGWARRGAPDALHLVVDAMPDDTTRAWLVALRRAGTHVTWSGEIAPVALAVEPVNAPTGGARLLVAAPSGSRITVRDAAGPLDTARVADGAAGAAMRVPALAEPVQVTLGGTTANAHAPDSLVPGAVLVLGTAGWETRYVVAALEESGWTVDARLTIGPGLTVRRGSPGAIDTSRYAAVVVLDSAASADGRRLAAYARSGGGLILSGVAASIPGLRDVAPGRVGPRIRPATMAFTATEPRGALGFVSITRLRDDAIALENRDGQSAVAVRRAALGRIMQIGYDESWRWRMQGGDGGPEAHRRWWSAVVAATASHVGVPRASPGAGRGAGAPRATLTAALGPPTVPPDAGAPTPDRQGPSGWLFVASALLLLADWTSRRLRGAA